MEETYCTPSEGAETCSNSSFWQGVRALATCLCSELFWSGFAAVDNCRTILGMTSLEFDARKA